MPLKVRPARAIVPFTQRLILNPSNDRSSSACIVLPLPRGAISTLPHPAAGPYHTCYAFCQKWPQDGDNERTTNMANRGSMDCHVHCLHGSRAWSRIRSGRVEQIRPSDVGNHVGDAASMLVVNPSVPSPES
jgi:hypothetical protein